MNIHYYANYPMKYTILYPHRTFWHPSAHRKISRKKYTRYPKQRSSTSKQSVSTKKRGVFCEPTRGDHGA